MAVPKFLKLVAGLFQEVAAIATSSGAGDADKIPATNASGVLDPSLLNAVATSSGAGDADKIPKLDGGGKLDSSMMPTGIGADVATITASEALSDGDYVNVWNSAGSFRVRKADASTSGKECTGFVKAAVSNGGSATVYLDGQNDHVTGMAPGAVYLDPANPGKGTTTLPTYTAGQVCQRLGTATSATAVSFEPGPAITTA